MADFLLEIAKGLGRLFLHPLFYLFLFMVYFMTIKRLKRERSQFHTRVYGGIEDIFHMVAASVIIGAIFSVLTLLLGIVIPFGVIVLIGACYVFTALTMKVRFLSPAYAVGISVIITYFMPSIETGQALIDRWLLDIEGASVASLGLLFALLILQETLLTGIFGSKKSSPILLKSKRGQPIGAHEVRKLWVVPLFLLVPGSAVSQIEWWPLLSFGSEAYSFFLVPFGIGFRQIVQHTLPHQAVAAVSKQMVWLSMFVIGTSVASIVFAFPLVVVAGAGIAILIKELILFNQQYKSEKSTPFYTGRSSGLLVLGILPASPAAKTGVTIGEVITKVNGRPMQNATDFYHALQVNAAFCKLEVLDQNNEIRFVQRSIYENEHHELGFLFVQPEKTNKQARSRLV
jgi:hypothetical protein